MFQHLPKHPHPSYISCLPGPPALFWCCRIDSLGLLQIVDVDDFSRHYLAQETPSSDCQWQTAPIWARVLSLATSGGTGAGVGAELVAPTATAGGGTQKSVTFDGGDGSSKDFHGFDGCTRENNSAFDMLSTATPFNQNTDNRTDIGSALRSPDVFARLWAECIGDDTCFISGGATVGTICAHGPETPSSRQHATPSPSNHGNLGPWQRLVSVLRDKRGVDVSRALTTHEQILLKREVADWLQRAQGRKNGSGKGMAERLASAAAAALRQAETAATTAAPERSQSSRAGETSAAASAVGTTAAAEDSNGSGGINNVSRRRLSAGGFEFPTVVAEGSSSPVGGSNAERAANRGPLAMTAGTEEETGAGMVAKGPTKTPERQLDLREVAVDAHEVRAFPSEVVVPLLVPPPCFFSIPAILRQVHIEMDMTVFVRNTAIASIGQ